jgi:hypothetical protein
MRDLVKEEILERLRNIELELAKETEKTMKA